MTTTTGWSPASGESEEGDSKERTETGNDLPLPGDGDRVSVAHSAHSDETPPQSVGERAELPVLHILLHLVHDEGGEHQDQKADVECCQEFLSVSVDHGAEEFPGAAPPIHPHHP